MISVYQFLDKLNTFYPSNDSEEVFRERANEYANNILLRCRNTKEQYDYDRVFRHILQTYKYKTFPSLPDILDALSYGLIIQESYSGREGETIKRTCRGFEYEFTVVPNHWDKVKTISELDEDITDKQKREIA